MLLLIALSLVATAAPRAAGVGGDGSNWGRMTEVYVDAKGSVLRVQFSRPVVNPSGCEGGDFYMLELDDSPGADRFLKALLAAHLAGRKVKFWIDGCTKQQWWGKTRPLIYDIYIGS